MSNTIASISCLLAIMASPHFDLFAAVRAGAVDYKLNTGAVSAVTAELVAGLTILYRIGAEISDKADCCPKCGAPVVAQTAVNSNTASCDNSTTSSEFVKKSQGNLTALKIGLAILGLIIAIICISESGKYYVAKVPGISAGSVKVDGYMHKSKSCCQHVADQFGCEVISVHSKGKAGTNEYGQRVSYEAAFSYCPLCCY